MGNMLYFLTWVVKRYPSTATLPLCGVASTLNETFEYIYDEYPWMCLSWCDHSGGSPLLW